MSTQEPSAGAKPESSGLSAFLSELMFALMPFVVLFIVFLYQGRSASAYLFAPEWAFASAVLFGQSLAKFVSSLASTGLKAKSERPGFVVAAIIVLGLVPAMVVLALLLVSSDPPIALGVAQVLLAVAAAVAFVLVGQLAHEVKSVPRK